MMVVDGKWWMDPVRTAVRHPTEVGQEVPPALIVVRVNLCCTVISSRAPCDGPTFRKISVVRSDMDHGTGTVSMRMHPSDCAVRSSTQCDAVDFRLHAANAAIQAVMGVGVWVWGFTSDLVSALSQRLSGQWCYVAQRRPIRSASGIASRFPGRHKGLNPQKAWNAGPGTEW